METLPGRLKNCFISFATGYLKLFFQGHVERQQRSRIPVPTQSRQACQRDNSARTPISYNAAAAAQHSQRIAAGRQSMLTRQEMISGAKCSMAGAMRQPSGYNASAVSQHVSRIQSGRPNEQNLPPLDRMLNMDKVMAQPANYNQAAAASHIQRMAETRQGPCQQQRTSLLVGFLVPVMYLLFHLGLPGEGLKPDLNDPNYRRQIGYDNQPAQYGDAAWQVLKYTETFQKS